MFVFQLKSYLNTEGESFSINPSVFKHNSLSLYIILDLNIKIKRIPNIKKYLYVCIKIKKESYKVKLQ